jgi:outer membrane murein-binding lipoprotein Lpp
MSLSKAEEDQLSGLLVAALHKPGGASFNDKLTAAEIIRKWFVHAIAALAIMGCAVWGAASYAVQIERNSQIAEQVKNLPVDVARLKKQMKEIRPLVRQHEWQVQQGLTNRELKERGMSAPEFPEDD